MVAMTMAASSVDLLVSTLAERMMVVESVQKDD